MSAINRIRTVSDDVHLPKTGENKTYMINTTTSSNQRAENITTKDHDDCRSMESILDLETMMDEGCSLPAIDVSRELKRLPDCSIYCVFYAEFDDIVGPTVCFSSPAKFMDHDIGITTSEIESLLGDYFTNKSNDDEKEVDRCNDRKEQHDSRESLVRPDSLSIFDATCEYIITGEEFTGQTISISVHNMHIIARPIIIKDTRYQRNSLVFSVGFAIRRMQDPSPFRPILNKISATLEAMEIEGSFLSSRKTRGQLQSILDEVLRGMNSKSSQCHILLDAHNQLHLQVFPVPKKHALPVPDHVVPQLLRPKSQLRSLEWDLTINWIVPHINGVHHVGEIARSSSVDAERVRVCLRVLKHHGIVKCIDIFRYSNIYESTEIAHRMLAGEEEQLLHEAFGFVCRFNQGNQNGSNAGMSSSKGSTVSRNFDWREPYNITPNVAVNAIAINNIGGSRRFLPPQQLASSSYPPTAQESSFNNRSTAGTSVALQSTGSYTGTESSLGGVTGSSIDIGSPPLASPYGDGRSSFYKKRKEEKEQTMLTALAILYVSCSRDKTFGDLLLSLISDDEEEDGEETMRLKLKMLAAENGFNIDWKEVFESFDHRRFVTFGVVYGLIRRVHQYPIACNSRNVAAENAANINLSEQTVNDCKIPSKIMSSDDKKEYSGLGGERGGRDDNLRNVKLPIMPQSKHAFLAASAKQHLRTKKLERQRQVSRLAHKIAAEMDGTRSDDELCCKFENSMKNLIDLVQKHTKKKVVSIYSYRISSDT